MKKSLLVLYAITLGMLSAASAQSFVVSNVTSVVNGLSTDFQISATAVIENATATDKNVMCERILNNLAGAHTSSFCWDQCYPAATNLCSQPVTISAMNSTSAFLGDLRPNSSAGVSYVDYKFYDQQNPADFVTISLTYNVGATGINEITSNVQIAAPRPNPADAFTYVGYSIKNNKSEVKIQIADLLGKTYFTKTLSEKSGVIIVPTAELQSGIYFLRAIENGKVTSTSKLIVSHK